MAVNYNDLINTINQSVKKNGNQEVTGSVMNAVLKMMTNFTLDINKGFNGLLTPASQVNKNTGFWIANSGTYPNFNLVVDENELAIVSYNDQQNKFVAEKVPLVDNVAIKDYVDTKLVDANLNFGGELNSLSDSPTIEGMYLPTIEGIYTNFNNLTYNVTDGFVMFLYKDNEYSKINVPLDVPTTNDVIPNSARVVTSEGVEKYAVKKINNILELKATQGQYNGQVITLLGYYTPNDAPQLNYKWSSTQDVDDGGSIINVGSGSWIADLGSVVYLENFGVNENEDSSSKINKIISLGFKNIDTYTKKTIIIDSSINVSDYLVFQNTAKSIFKLKDNRPVLTPVFFADRKKGFKISAIIDGNRDNQTATGSQDGGLHGISITGCEDYDIEDCLIYNMRTDGVYIKPYGTTEGTYISSINARINRVTCFNCRRQGLSVIAINGINITNSTFNNTVGTAPQAGIDFEPNNAWETINNVHISNCVINNNSGRGILFHVISKCSNVTITNTEIKDNLDNSIVMTGGGIYENINIYQNKHINQININTAGSTIFQMKELNIYGNNHINQLVLRNVNIGKIFNNKIDAIQVLGSNDSLDIYLNNFENITNSSTTDSTALILLGISSTTVPSKNINIYGNKFKNCSIKNAIYVSSIFSSGTIYGNTFESIKGNSGRVIYFQNSKATLKVYSNVFKNNTNVVYNISESSENVIIEDSNIYEGNNILTSGYLTNNKNKLKFGDVSLKIKSASNSLPDMNGVNYDINDEVLNRTPINGILKWICTTGGTSSVWKPITLIEKSIAVANVATADATDLATALVLINELKKKLNDKLTADRASGQQL